MGGRIGRTRGGYRRRSKAALWLAAGVLLAPLSVIPAAHASGSPAPDCTPDDTTSAYYCHVLYHYTGAEQSFTVPAGITSIEFTAYGGRGAGPNGMLSNGGTFTAIFAVGPGETLQAGETLYVEVGGDGSGTTGGWNGGGDGGVRKALTPGFGGGGATDVRTCKRGSTCGGTSSLGSRIVVAGGGGGAGGDGASCWTGAKDVTVSGGAGANADVYAPAASAGNGGEGEGCSDGTITASGGVGGHGAIATTGPAQGGAGGGGNPGVDAQAGANGTLGQGGTGGDGGSGTVYAGGAGGGGGGGVTGGGGGGAGGNDTTGNDVFNAGGGGGGAGSSGAFGATSISIASGGGVQPMVDVLYSLPYSSATDPSVSPQLGTTSVDESDLPKTVALSATASPGTSPGSTGLTVTADLSSLGLSSTYALYDDGTHGDATAGDLKFHGSFQIPTGLDAGTYPVTFTVSDAQSRTTTSSAIDITVHDDVGPAVPSISAGTPTSTAPEVDATATDADRGGSKISAAELFVDSTGTDGSGLGMQAQDGSFDETTEGLVLQIPDSTWDAVPVGPHTIYVHAEDAAGNWGPFKTMSVTKIAVPDPPTNVQAAITFTGGAAYVQVSFDPPSADGGSTVTSYTVTAHDLTSPAHGGQTLTGSGSPLLLPLTALRIGDVYEFTVTATNAVGDSAESAASNHVRLAVGGSSTGSPGQPGQQLTVTRLAGANRIGTAVAVSKDAFGSEHSASTVVLASSAAPWDALTGAPLAAHVHGPVLLTRPGSLPGATAAEIARVLPVHGGTVDVLGGKAAVSPDVVAALSGSGYTVHRLAGATRYGTAVAVAHALGDPSTVMLASGRNFPDALSLAPAAIERGAAVLLTRGDHQADAVGSYLSAHPGGSLIAVGGPACSAAPAASCVSGANRYATSAAVAKRFFPAPVSAVGIATGRNFPDAMAAAPDMAGHHGPLLLVPPTGALPSPVAQVLAGYAAGSPSLFVFGGTAAVPASQADEVVGALTAGG